MNDYTTAAAELAKRLRASVNFDAPHGDRLERTICARQMTEAADLLESLAAELKRVEFDRSRLLDRIASEEDATSGALLRLAEAERENARLRELLAKNGIDDSAQHSA